MDGQYTSQSLDEISEDELQTLQRQQLTEQQKEAEKNLDKKKQHKLIIAGVWCSSAVIQLIASNFFLGVSHLLCSGMYLMGLYGPYKLKREIQLAAWIHDNRERVDEVIQEEVKTNQRTQNIDYNNYEYPREIVEEGISLNNLEHLSNKTLKQLKKKALKK